MSNWERIGSLADVRRGASPRPIGDPRYFGGEVGWVRIVDVTRSNRFLRQTDQYLSPLGESLSVRVRPGDLVMSICGTIGRPIIIDMPACIHDGFVQFSNLRGVDPTYLYYVLQYAEPAFCGMGQPGTQVNLNTSLVSKYRIFCPGKNEQHRIAEILSTIDETIEQTEALIAKYQQIKAGLMHDLFTRGVTPDGKLRPTREEAPHLYQESPLGWIPKEWDVATVGNCLAGIDAGKSPECPDIPASGDQWGVLKVGAVNPNGLCEEENKIVEDERLKNSAFLVRHNDLLISRANTFDLVGLVCHVMTKPRNLMLSDKTLRLQPNLSRVTTRFLFWSLQTASARRQIENSATGTSGSMKNISQGGVRSIQVVRPSAS